MTIVIAIAVAAQLTTTFTIPILSSLSVTVPKYYPILILTQHDSPTFPANVILVAYGAKLVKNVMAKVVKPMVLMIQMDHLIQQRYSYDHAKVHCNTNILILISQFFL